MSKKQKTISSWEWTTLVGAWRYYSNRSTIASSMFPAELVERYFQGDYSVQDCERIARQFVHTDFRSDGELSWASLSSVDRNPWCKLFAFLKAYLKGWEEINGIECFYCEATERHCPKDEYIKNPHVECYINKEAGTVKRTMKGHKTK